MANTTYLSLVDFRAYGLNGTSGMSDAIAQTYLDTAADKVDSLCRTKFESTALTEEYCGDGERTLWVNHLPVISITSVTIDGSTSWTEDTDYFLVDERRLVIPESDTFNARTRSFSSVWPRGTNNVDIVYNYGYATTPDPVKLAIAKLVQAWYTQDGSEGLSAESLGPRSVSYGSDSSSGVPMIVTTLLQNYVEAGVRD